MRRARRRVIVVGAGTAGCIVASVLSEDPDLEVLLLERGPDRPPDVADGTEGADYLAALRVPERQSVEAVGWCGPYVRGSGVGGSGAINGLLAEVCWPMDGQGGLDGWWSGDLTPAFATISASTDVCDEAPGAADEVLLRGADKFVGVDAAQLFLRNGVRQSTDVSHLAPARTRPNLTVQSSRVVERIELDGRRAVGVFTSGQVASGEVVEADTVIVCAGAVTSPLLLQSSGVQRLGIGENLHDHFGVVISLGIGPTPEGAGPLTTRIGSTPTLADWHAPPMRFVPINPTATTDATLLCGGFHQYGRGRLRNGAPIVLDNDPYTDERDAEQLRTVARKGFGIVERAGVTFERPSERDLDAWIMANRAPIFHAAGTCRIGRPDDDLAVVDPACKVIGHEGLYVIDASVFFAQPDGAPCLPTAALALVAATRLSERLAHP